MDMKKSLSLSIVVWHRSQLRTKSVLCQCLHNAVPFTLQAIERGGNQGGNDVLLSTAAQSHPRINTSASHPFRGGVWFEDTNEAVSGRPPWRNLQSARADSIRESHQRRPTVLSSKAVFQVETLLEQLEAKFDEMSSQILDRSLFSSPCPRRLPILTDVLLVAHMSNRVDALENAIQDIISGDMTTPGASPTQFPPTPVPRRSGTGVS